MKIKNILLLTLAAAVATACSSTRYASTEYDDVYFTSKDEVAVSGTSYTEYNDNYLAQSDADYEAARQAYYQGDYDSDDFYFSRRIRRFHQPNNSSWRYYDPYFSNDLYYVIGTNSWNTWYNNGWYNWNQPRFGYSVGFGNGFGWGSYSTFAFSSGWGAGFPGYAYDPWLASSYNYFNPWVNAYYGYAPIGWGGFNPAFPGAFGFGPGLGFGYGGALYCPPSYYGAGGFSSAALAQSSLRTAARRSSTQSVSSQVGSGNNNTGTVKPGASRRLSAPTQGNNSSSTSAGVYTGRSAAPNYLTPQSRSNSGSAPSTLSSPRTGTSSPRVYTSPGSRSTTTDKARRNSFFNSPSNRSYQAPTRSTSPSNNSRSFSTPSRSNSNNSFNRSSSPSFNRSPSSTPSRTPSSSPGGVRRR